MDNTGCIGPLVFVNFVFFTTQTLGKLTYHVHVRGVQFVHLGVRYDEAMHGTEEDADYA